LIIRKQIRIITIDCGRVVLENTDSLLANLRRRKTVTIIYYARHIKELDKTIFYLQ